MEPMYAAPARGRVNITDVIPTRRYGSWMGAQYYDLSIKQFPSWFYALQIVSTETRDHTDMEDTPK